MAEGMLTEVNGNVYSFQSAKLELGDPPQVFERVSAIAYDHSLDPEELRGAGAKPLDDTTGVYKTRASLSLYLADWRVLRRMLSEMPGPGGFMQKRFTITVSYADTGEPEIMTDTLRGVRVRHVSRAYRTGGAGALMVDLELYVREILEDGLAAVSQGFEDLIAGLAAG